MSKLKPAVSDQDHQTGKLDASITLVEYGDYQCPHCGHAYPLLKRLVEEKGKSFRFVFRNFPLQEAHPAAFMAALAAEAAARQEKFWEMHDIIFENQDNLHGDSFLKFAKSVGLEIKTFSRDWESKELAAKVEADFEGGIRSGVNGTPSFFLNGNKFEDYDGTYESLAAAV